MQLPRKFQNRTAITKKEYADMFCISVQTVERMIKRGQIPLIEKKFVGVQDRIPISFLKKIYNSNGSNQSQF